MNEFHILLKVLHFLLVSIDILNYFLLKYRYIYPKVLLFIYNQNTFKPVLLRFPMKHSYNIVFFLLLFFILAQVAGLHIISQYIDISASANQGETVIRPDTYIFQPPEVQNESFSFIYVLLALGIGTALVLLIVKFALVKVWRFWFASAIVIALSIAIHPYSIVLFGQFALLITASLAVGLTVLKLRKYNLVIHNVTEILVYGGIAALFVPILNLFAISVLLVVMSIYDVYAVRGSKHMVKMAEFQTKSHLFAGLMTGIPTQEKTGKRAAVLGGGDIAFPLLFGGVLLKTAGSFVPAFLAAGFAAIGLLVLLVLAEKGKFYPALPAVSIGAFIGYGLYLLL
jgi:presenilin-like A22 family membrane protease